MKRTLSIALAIILTLSSFASIQSLVTRAAVTNNEWISKVPLPRPECVFGMTTAYDKIYVIGGLYNGSSGSTWSDANYEYDPATDSWVSRAVMPTKRSALVAVTVDNKLHAIGGAASASGGALSNNEVYDPMSDSWTTKASMPTPRDWMSAATADGKIFVLGGSNNAGGIYSTNEMYDPSTNTWTTKASLPTPRLACGAGVVNGKIYLIGGWIRPGSPPGQPTGLNQQYDPATNSWSTKAPMPTARNGLAIAVVNNRIYAIGGATNFNPWTDNLNVVEEYNPATDTWKTIQAMPTQRSLLGAAAIVGKIYAVGGMNNNKNFLDKNEQLNLRYTVGTVGYWKFDEGLGNIVHDSSGSGYDGTVNNALWANGLFGGALDFNGVNSYVEMAGSGALNPAEISVEAWVNFHSLPAPDSYTVGSIAHPVAMIVSKGTDDLVNGYFGLSACRMPPEAPVNFQFYLCENGHQRARSTTEVVENRWYYVVGTYDGSTLRLYVNGVLEDEETFGVTRTSNNGDVIFGALRKPSFEYWLNGTMDEVRIYNYARTAEDIFNDATHPRGRLILTFDTESDAPDIDDAPSPEKINGSIRTDTLNVIEDIGSNLIQRGLLGTFFVQGAAFEYKDGGVKPTAADGKDFSQIISQLHNSGHEIASHTYTHLNLEQDSNFDYLSTFELPETANEIFKATGEWPKGFRAPYYRYGGHEGGDPSRLWSRLYTEYAYDSSKWYNDPPRTPQSDSKPYEIEGFPGLFELPVITDDAHLPITNVTEWKDAINRAANRQTIILVFHPQKLNPALASAEAWSSFLEILDYIESEEQQDRIQTMTAFELASQNRACAVVRGLDNRIYYRSYVSSGSWETWNALQSGTTFDSPAAVLLDNELHTVVRGMDGHSIWHSYVNLTDSKFSGWTLLGGSTSSSPALASNATHLSLVVRGENDLIYYRFYAIATRTWTNWVALPSGATIDSPAATTLGNKLHIVVRGLDGYTLWHSSVDLSTQAFSGWELVGGATQSKPTLVSCQSRNEIILVVRGLNNLIYRNAWSPSSWTGWSAFPNGATCDGVGATVIGETLHVIVRGMDGFTLWHAYTDLATNTFSSWTLLSGLTPSKPTLTS